MNDAIPQTPDVDGTQPRIVSGRGRNGGHSLVVNGVTQSHVNLDDPTDLQLNYVRRISFVVDIVAPAGTAIRALHLGAGALTIARYIAATRPGSKQFAVELDSGLADLVTNHLPLASGADVTLRIGDARAVAEGLPADHAGATDLVVVDVFSGDVAPLHIATKEFLELLDGLLSPAGIVVINVLSTGNLGFAKAELATVATVFPELAVIVPDEVSRGAYGNLAIVASRVPIDTTSLAERARTDEHAPAAVLVAAQARAFAGRALPLDDARVAAGVRLGGHWNRVPRAVARRLRRGIRRLLRR
ncbi:MAG: fused MFS/spermidine synthase [Rhodoglobus sp.]